MPHARPDKGDFVGVRLLVVGRLRPELGVSGFHEGLPVADLRQPEAVQDAVARLGDVDGAVLVLCTTADAPETRRQLALLDVALPGVTTVLEVVRGGALAVSVIAGLVDDTTGTRDCAEQLGSLDELRAELWSAVWLPSVARLDTPHPSLVQHVRGWLPHAGFLAVHSPRPAVLNAPGPDRLPDLDAPTPGVLFVADAGSDAWVVPALVEAIGPSTRLDTRTWRDPRDAYGVSRSAELVVVPDHLERPHRRVVAGAVECVACGRRHPRRACPFCRMAVSAAADHDELSGAQS